MTDPTDPRVEAAVDAVIKSRGWRDNCWGDGAIGGFDYSTDTKPRHVIRDHEAEAKEGKTVILFETEDYDEYQREYRRICIRREVRAAIKAADEAAWQPIESAPVEETIDIWVQHKDGSHREPEVMLSDDRKRWVINLDEWDADEINATHWRPRPVPPTP